MLVWTIPLDNEGINHIQKQKHMSVWDNSSGHWDVLTSIGEVSQIFYLWSRGSYFALRATSKGTKMLRFCCCCSFSKRNGFKQKKRWFFPLEKKTVTVKWSLERQRILLDTCNSLGLQNTSLYMTLKAGAGAALFKLSGALDFDLTSKCKNFFFFFLNIVQQMDVCII